MLSTRALSIQRLTSSSAAAVKRNYATTVADVTTVRGVKVASVDFGQPTSAVTIFVKAGSRFQGKEGLANVLKNFAFKVCEIL